MRSINEKLLFFLKKISNNKYYKQYIDFDKLDINNVWDVYLNLPIMEKNRVIDNIYNYFSDEFYDDCKNLDLNSVFFETKTMSKNHDKIINGIKNKWVVEFTTGSTGIPFPIVKSSSVKMVESAYLLKQRKKYDRGISLNNGFKFIHSLQPELSEVDIWKFKDEDKKRVVECWMINKPRWMLATPLIYSKYADYMIKNHIDIFSMNEMSFLEYTSQAMLPEERKKIQSVYKCPLVSSFGTRECWNIAFECTKGNLHVNSDYLIVDLVDDDGKIIDEYDKEGNVLITHLANIHMPLIKYKFGDRAKKLRIKCSCGNASEILCFCPDRENARLVNTPYYGTNIFRRVMRGIYFHDYITDIENISIIQDDNFHISVYIDKQQENDQFFEKCFVDRVRSVVPEINKFCISFIYGPFLLNEMKNCKSVIFKNTISMPPK